jgi:hypothetical protein
MTNKTVIIDDWDTIFPFTTEAFKSMTERRKSEGWSLVDATEKETSKGASFEYHWQKEIIHNENRQKEMFSELFGLLQGKPTDDGDS